MGAPVRSEAGRRDGADDADVLEPGDARASAVLLGGYAVLVAVVHVLVHTDVHYRVAIEPVLLVFAATGGVDLARRLGPARACGAAAAYAGVQALAGVRYAEVFALLRRVTHALGLG